MMISRYLKSAVEMILFTCLVCFLSCARKEVIPIPLSEEQLVDIMIDIHLVESMIERLPVLDRDTVGGVYYRMIFRDHNVTKEEFDESISVLREDPERLDVIYVEVMEKLNVLEAKERGVEEMK